MRTSKYVRFQLTGEKGDVDSHADYSSFKMLLHKAIQMYTVKSGYASFSSLSPTDRTWDRGA